MRPAPHPFALVSPPRRRAGAACRAAASPTAPLAVVADRRGRARPRQPRRARPRRRGCGAAWRSGTPARSARRSSPGRTSRTARGGFLRRAPALGRALHPLGGRGRRRREALAPRRHRLRPALRRRGGARRPGRGRGGGARPVAPARPRRHPRRRLGGRPLRRRRHRCRRMPGTPSTRRRAPPARGRRSGAGSAAARRRRLPAAGDGPAGSCRPGRPSPPSGRCRSRRSGSRRRRWRRCRPSGSAASSTSPPCRGRSSPAASGRGVGRRLDQALGRVAEPVSPARPPHVFALRLTLPEPIGLEADVLAGIDRLLPPLCARLAAAGPRRPAGAARRSSAPTDAPSCARSGSPGPTDRPEAIRPLLALQLGDVDAGFGIEVIRLEATRHRAARGRRSTAAGSRPARGRDASRRPRPTSSAGSAPGSGSRRWSACIRPTATSRRRARPRWRRPSAAPAAGWPRPAAPRPILLFPPEPLTPGDDRRPARPPSSGAAGRAAAPPPSARSGSRPNGGSTTRPGARAPRDYWRVETEDGTRLWIYEAKGGETLRRAGSPRGSSHEEESGWRTAKRSLPHDLETSQ